MEVAERSGYTLEERTWFWIQMWHEGLCVGAAESPLLPSGEADDKIYVYIMPWHCAPAQRSTQRPAPPQRDARHIMTTSELFDDSGRQYRITTTIEELV